MKLTQRRKYVLYKLAFTHEVQWAERPAFKYWPRYDIKQSFPTLDGQDISCVIKSLRRMGLAKVHAPKGVLCITPRGMDALLESVA